MVYRVVSTIMIRPGSVRLWAAASISIFVMALTCQVLIPPVIGLADNGDFFRITAPLGLEPLAPPESRFFDHIVTEYVITGNPIGRQVFYSGELFAHCAVKLSQLRMPAGRFDIRWLGFTYAVVLCGLFSLFIHFLSRWGNVSRGIASVVVIWIFTDAMYSAYLNSFYTDVAGWLSFLTVVLALVFLLTGRSVAGGLVMFTTAGLVLATSKPQNAVVVIPISGFLTYIVLTGSCGRMQRVVGCIVAICVATVGLVYAVTVTRIYGQPALISVVMARIAKQSPQPLNDVRFFGLDGDDLKYAGMHAFMPNGPGSNPGFVSRFSKTTAATLALYYVEHPALAAGFIMEDLRVSGPRNRTLFGNFEKRDGVLPRAQSAEFVGWSRLRAMLFQIWPSHVFVLYAAALAAPIAVCVRSRRTAARRPFALLIALLGLVGLIQLCLASLFDATETERHLFMFHANTDVLIVAALIGALEGWPTDKLGTK